MIFELNIFDRKFLLLITVTFILIFTMQTVYSIITFKMLTSAEEVTESEQVDSPDVSITAYAREYLGCKYVWGGSGPDTFDCSGFTMYVYDNFDVKLPHSSRLQALCGTEVSKEDLKPGDLVFFATSKKRRISHVGIYIENGDFIHASSNGVTINSLSESYYEKRYMKAVRILAQNVTP